MATVSNGSSSYISNMKAKQILKETGNYIKNHKASTGYFLAAAGSAAVSGLCIDYFMDCEKIALLPTITWGLDTAYLGFLGKWTLEDENSEKARKEERMREEIEKTRKPDIKEVIGKPDIKEVVERIKELKKELESQGIKGDVDLLHLHIYSSSESPEKHLREIDSMFKRLPFNLTLGDFSGDGNYAGLYALGDEREKLFPDIQKKKEKLCEKYGLIPFSERPWYDMHLKREETDIINVNTWNNLNVRLNFPQVTELMEEIMTEANANPST